MSNTRKTTMTDIPKMTKEEALCIISNELQFVMRLRCLACLPESHWPKAAKSLIQTHYDRELTDEELSEVLTTYREIMLVEQIQLGRAVQPTGEDIHILAPIIAAIRLKSGGVDHAVQFLLNHMLTAIRNGDGETFRQISKFSEGDLGKHCNFLIWKAIAELMIRSAPDCPSPRSGKKMVTFLPTKDEVKDFVFKAQLRGEFLSLPHDRKSWNRLWSASGAKILMPIKK